MTNKPQTGTEHSAIAKSLDLSISTKHSIEISRSIRYKSTTSAKKILEDAINLRKAIPFRKFKKDMGHKRGMAAGRYPKKAANEFMRLIKSVEANAQSKGLDVGNLKITKIISNLASIPFTGGRRRTGTKRTNLEIEVKEFSKNKESEKKGEKTSKTVSVKKEDLKTTASKSKESKLQEEIKQ